MAYLAPGVYRHPPHALSPQTASTEPSWVRACPPPHPSRHCVVGMQGSMAFRLRSCMDIEYIPPHHGSGHNTGNYINSLELSCTCKSASQAVLRGMQLTLYATRRTPPHGASRSVVSNACLVGENPACSVLTSVGTRGSSSYGHTTTVMHEY